MSWCPPPCKPNLTDYVGFLYGQVEIPPDNLPTASGIATSGSTTNLADTDQTWTVDQWQSTALNPYIVTDTSQETWARIASSDATSVTFNALPNPINVGDAYWITPAVVTTSLYIALQTVNLQLCVTGLYEIAVYNLAADRLINYANDIPNQTYFKQLRTTLKINAISLGVITSASDQGTAAAITNPEQFKNFTLGDLQNLKTPQGRAYLSIAQDVGSIWGTN